MKRIQMVTDIRETSLVNTICEDFESEGAEVEVKALPEGYTIIATFPYPLYQKLLAALAVVALWVFLIIIVCVK